MVLLQRPHHLSLDEGEAWLRNDAAALAGADGVRRATLGRLVGASRRWGPEWDWLIELDCDDHDAATRAVRGEAGALLLGDLRLLGMRPPLAIVAERGPLRP
jgi:hypothetical protein